MIVRSLILSALIVSVAAAGDVTYNKDVLPIMQKNCQSCHRPGEIGPMPLLTYESTRPWAKSIKEAVLTKKMPPWFADPRFGHFANDRALSKPTSRPWSPGWMRARRKAMRKTCRRPSNWRDGWNIKPDRRDRNAKAVQRSRAGHHRVHLLRGSERLSTKDTWVIDAEVRPGNRTVVHHGSATFVRRVPVVEGRQWSAKPYVLPKRNRMAVSLLSAGGSERERNIS